MNRLRLRKNSNCNWRIVDPSTTTSTPTTSTSTQCVNNERKPSKRRRIQTKLSKNKDDGVLTIDKNPPLSPPGTDDLADTEPTQLDNTTHQTKFSRDDCLLSTSSSSSALNTGYFEKVDSFAAQRFLFLQKKIHN